MRETLLLVLLAAFAGALIALTMGNADEPSEGPELVVEEQSVP